MSGREARYADAFNELKQQHEVLQDAFIKKLGLNRRLKTRIENLHAALEAVRRHEPRPSSVGPGFSVVLNVQLNSRDEAGPPSRSSRQSVESANDEQPEWWAQGKRASSSPGRRPGGERAPSSHGWRAGGTDRGQLERQSGGERTCASSSSGQSARGTGSEQPEQRPGGERAPNSYGWRAGGTDRGQLEQQSGGERSSTSSGQRARDEDRLHNKRRAGEERQEQPKVVVKRR
jgi:hypothetical protein